MDIVGILVYRQGNWSFKSFGVSPEVTQLVDGSSGVKSIQPGFGTLPLLILFQYCHGKAFCWQLKCLEQEVRSLLATLRASSKHTSGTPWDYFERLNYWPSSGAQRLAHRDRAAQVLPLSFSCWLGTCGLIPHLFPCREIHLHRGKVSPGTTDGLLSDSDVYPQPTHRHPVLGLLLDQHGCCPCPSGPRHHHCAHHDNSELWLPGLFA